jgi:hypothetical protein
MILEVLFNFMNPTHDVVKLFDVMDGHTAAGEESL